MLERIPNRVESSRSGAGAIYFSLSRFFQSSARSLYNSRATSPQTSFPTPKLNFYKRLDAFAPLARRITTKLSKTDTSFAPNTRDSGFSKNFRGKSGKRQGCERSSGYVYQVSTHPRSRQTHPRQPANAPRSRKIGPRSRQIGSRTCWIDPRTRWIDPRSCWVDSRTCRVRSRSCQVRSRSRWVHPRSCWIDPRSCQVESRSRWIESRSGWIRSRRSLIDSRTRFGVVRSCLVGLCQPKTVLRSRTDHSRARLSRRGESVRDSTRQSCAVD
jgi:hypothetical protein